MNRRGSAVRTRESTIGSATHCLRHLSREPAFTLIELLVVISIITLLLAILLPSLSQARKISQRTKCGANLHEIATAWAAYSIENGGRFFQGVNANINYAGKQGALPAYRRPKILNPSLGGLSVETDDAPVCRCPSDAGTPLAAPTCYEYYGTSYMTNLMLIGQDQIQVDPSDPCASVMQDVNTRLRNLVEKDVSDHSRVLLVGDVGWVEYWYFDPNGINVYWHDKKHYYSLAFLDGHAEFLKIRKGISVDENYAVIPFQALWGIASSCQQEVPD